MEQIDRVKILNLCSDSESWLDREWFITGSARRDAFSLVGHPVEGPADIS